MSTCMENDPAQEKERKKLSITDQRSWSIKTGID